MLTKYGKVLSALVYFMSSVLIVLGLTVMLGWVFKTAAVVQLFPNYAPMQFNTALCFFISGSALICLCYDSKTINFIPFALLLAIAVPTLLQYLFALNFGIDNLFVEPFISTGTPYPGRMALVTTWCFIFFAIFILLIRILKTELWFLVGIFPTFIGVLGTISLLGYLFDIKQIYTLSSVTYMALHTSIGFIVLAIGLFLILFMIFDLNSHQKETILDTTVFFFTTVLVFAIWLTVRGNIVEQIAEETNRRLGILESQIIVKLESEALALSRLFARYEIETYSNESTLKQDVYHYFKDIGSLVSVNFNVNSNLSKSTYINPNTDKKLAMALNLKCKETANKASNYDDVKVYRISDSGQDFYCFYKENAIAIVDLSGILKSFTHNKSSNFHFQIIAVNDANNKQKADLSINEDLNALQIEKIMNIFGNKYVILGYPNTNYIQQALSRYPSYIVLVSFVFAILFLILSRNRRQLRNKEAQLKSYEILNYTLLSSVGESIIGIDRDNKINFINESAQILLGYELKAGVQVDIGTVLKTDHTKTEDTISELVDKSIKYSVTVKRSRINLVLGNGKILPVLFSSSPIMENGMAVGAIIVLFDISERIQYEEELQKIAHYDSLTNLPNRYSIMYQIERSIARANREAISFALCFIDINKFKMINDTYGHNVGDKSLQFLGDKIQQNIRKNDFSGRLSGDEFCIILEGVSEGSQVEAFIAKLKSSLSEPFYLNNMEIPIDISVGYVFYEKGMTAEALLTFADNEMYKNKRSSAS